MPLSIPNGNPEPSEGNGGSQVAGAGFVPPQTNVTSSKPTSTVPSVEIGDAATGGPGSQTVTSEVGGDLGSRYQSLNSFLLLQEALRENASFNGMRSLNHRYRGHREAGKFNLAIQQVLAMCVTHYLTLKEANTTLQDQELDEMYPTDAEIQAFYHIREQIEFKEWLLLKDENRRWFV